MKLKKCGEAGRKEYARSLLNVTLICVFTGLVVFVAITGLITAFLSAPKNVGTSSTPDDNQIYNAWEDDVEIELADLPDAEYYAKRVKELFDVASIPTVNLFTARDVIENDVYVPLSMTITDSTVIQNSHDSVAGKIKPRGNSTYEIGREYGAMPYTIKLDTPSNFLDMGKSKKWCLLANFIDRAYVKQFIAFQMAQLIMGDGYFQPQAKFVEVYLNGEYKGLYLLAESIEEENGRLGLEADLINHGAHVPFLLEMDLKQRLCTASYKPHIQDDFETLRFLADSHEKTPYWLLDDDTENDDCSYTPYDLKYPDGFEEINAEQQGYIRRTMYDLYESVAKGLSFDRLPIDVDSFVNYLIFTELTHHVAYMEASTFIYKQDTSDELVYGPLWDFDMDMLTWSSEYFLVSGDRGQQNTLISGLLRYTAFQRLLRERYTEYYSVLLPQIKTAIISLKDNAVVKRAVLKAEGKYRTWGRRLNSHNNSNTGDIDNRSDVILTLKSYEEHVDYIYDWLFDSHVGANGRRRAGRAVWIKENLDVWGVDSGS